MTYQILCMCVSVYVHALLCTLMCTYCTHLQICLCPIVIGFHGEDKEAGHGNQQREFI